MYYAEAKRIVFCRKFFAIIIGIPALLSTIVSILKIFYFRLNDGTKFGQAVTHSFQTLINKIAQATPQLNFFWESSPVPDPNNFLVANNIKFAGIYFLIFIAMALWSSASKTSAILKEIDLENKKDRLRGTSQREITSNKKSNPIQANSIFSELHTLYIAPLIVGLLIAIFTKYYG